MKKLSALIPIDRVDETLRALQRLRCVAVERLDTESESDLPTESPPNEAENASVSSEPAKSGAPDDETLPAFLVPQDIAGASELDGYDVSERLAEAEDIRSRLEAAISFLDEHYTAKHKMFPTPETLTPEDFEKDRLAGAEAALRKAKELSDALTAARRREAELTTLIDALAPFESVDLPLPRFSTEYTETVCGTIPPSCDAKALGEALGSLACVFDIISESKTCRAAALTAYRDDFDECLATAASFGFIPATVEASAAEGCAAGRAQKARAELGSCRDASDDKANEAEECANESLGELKTYLDYIETTIARLDESAKMRVTSKCAVVGAYVPEKSADKVADTLDALGAAWEFFEPDSEREDVPVALENDALGSQFEPIVALYSLPKYGTFDPSLIMSFFYILIFGLMFADVGYGLTLLVGCLLGLKLMHPKPGLKKFLTMFAICGVSSMVGGALFGGYFGDFPTRMMEDVFNLKPAPDMAFAFNMIDQPISFLVVALAMGAIHLVCGMVIKLILLWKDGKVFEAIFDVGSWLVLFAGIGAYFINSLVGLIVIGVGVVMLVATQGREAKNPIVRIGKGIFSLYDLISYGSDLLSYSRILALSLASAVIANVVNIFVMMLGMPLGIVVFLVGHLLNFAVNILGTYVHTSRLQYIEFFGKFYESGGRAFAPLSPQENHVLFN